MSNSFSGEPGLRVFVAALIPQEIKNEIKQYVDEVRSHWDGVKWESQEKLHLTLKFLGELEESKVVQIEKQVGETANFYSPFDLEVSRFGGLPDLRNPRVLFIGLAENAGLSKFQKELEERLTELGFKREDRRFIPHVTVGRIKGKSRIKGSLPLPKRLPFFITEVAVMKSVLKREGSKHAPLSVFRLGK